MSENNIRRVSATVPDRHARTLKHPELAGRRAILEVDRLTNCVLRFTVNGVAYQNPSHNLGEVWDYQNLNDLDRPA